MMREPEAGIGHQGLRTARIRRLPRRAPAARAMASETRELHDAIDAHARRAGIP